MANSLRRDIQIALRDLFGTAIPEARVERGWQTSRALEEITIGEAHIFREYAGLGGNPSPHRETIRVQCAFTVQRDKREDADGRLDVVLEAAETALRGDHTLSIAGVQWARFAEVRTNLTRTDENEMAEAIVTVEALTRP